MPDPSPPPPAPPAAHADTPPLLELDGPRATLRLNPVQALAGNDAATITAMKRSLAELAGGRADPAVLERRYPDSLASPALRGRLERLLDH